MSGMDDPPLQALTGQLDRIENQLEEVLTLLQANQKKPSGTPMVHPPPTPEQEAQWLGEVTDENF
jgi:hypothetical protein